MSKEKTKYPALKAIASIHNGFGYGFIITAFVVGGMGFEKILLGEPTPLIIAIGILFCSLYCFFVAQLIQLFIDIEYNTRNASK